MRSIDRTSGIGAPSAGLDARVMEFVNVFEGMRELPTRFGVGAPPEAPDPTLLRDALERLRLEHEELCLAREVVQAGYEELEVTRRALERERQRYRDLFDDAPVPHLRTDRRGIIREVNRAAGRMLGVEPSYLVGRALETMVEGVDGVGVAGALEQLGVDGAIEVGVRVSGPDRSATRAVLHATPAGDGVLWSVRTACVDPEPRRGADRDAIEELAAASRAKDHVLAILGHELRTPINVILGWSSLVRQGRLGADEQARAMAVIERTAWTQAALLDRLLDASRLTAHKLMVVTTRLDLGELARQAVEAVAPLAAPKGVRVLCEAPRGSSCTATPTGSRRCSSTCSPTRSSTHPRGPRWSCGGASPGASAGPRSGCRSSTTAAASGPSTWSRSSSASARWTSGRSGCRAWASGSSSSARSSPCTAARCGP